MSQTYMMVRSPLYKSILVQHHGGQTTTDQLDYESLEYQFLSYILRAQPVRLPRWKVIKCLSF